MRATIVLLTVISCWSARASAEPDAAKPNPVTTVLPADTLHALAGCWRWSPSSRNFAETWTFRPKGDHGLAVVRTIDASRPEAERARIPQDVMYDPTIGNYAIAAAGRIHAAMFVFKLDHGRLVGDSYYSRHPGSYAPTGNTLLLERCR